MIQDIQKACFLINAHSGGGQGHFLRGLLAAALPHAQLHDLISCDLVQTLHQAQEAQQRVVVCGGDGSIASVLDTLYDETLELAPAIIPMGTGNDLAKTLGWSGLKDAPLDRILADLAAGEPEHFDRMCIQGPGLQRTWYNYCSWGLDAEIAYHFDLLRKQQRHLFISAGVNKVVYAYLGLRHRGTDLTEQLHLGTSDPCLRTALPQGCRTLLCTNINSYAGGMRLGPQVDHADRRFDVFALPHVLNLMPVLMGRRRLASSGQAQRMAVHLEKATTMQCDGEAFRAAAGHYVVSSAGQISILRNCSRLK